MINQMIISTKIFIFCTLALVLNLNSATITALSCSQADVQSAINVASDGDIVIVPAGNSTWATPVTISQKSIIVQGAGMERTVITDATGGAYLEAPFSIEGVLGKPFRITGFTFNGTSTAYGAICIYGTCRDWRIDHCEFRDLGGRGIRIQKSYTYGVVDHCLFSNCSQGIGIIADGDAAWERPHTPGTVNAVYIEDCIFNYNDILDGALDAYNGARYVFRYNQVNNTFMGHHGRDSGTYRSTHSCEIYENTYTAEKNVWTGLMFRGGTGILFNNTFNGNYSNSIYVTNYCSCKDYGAKCDPPWDQCVEYPCIDQIGRTTEQELEPFYEWGNTKNETDADIEIRGFPDCDIIYDHIQENRDFYNDTQRPGYTPYTYPHPLIITPPDYLRIIKAK